MSVLQFVSHNVTYWEADPRAASVWHYPIETISQGAGDCKDYSSLTIQILHLLGIDARFIGAEIRNRSTGGVSGHALISINGQYYEPQNPTGEVQYDVVRVFWNWSYQEMRKHLLEVRKNGVPHL